MRWLSFRRRPRGRHALGAAVTQIPSAPELPPVQFATPPAPQPELVAEPAGGHAYVPSWSPSPPQPSPEGSPASTRVELGFRDGTRAELDPDSEQAKALDELAQLLTRRD